MGNHLGIYSFSQSLADFLAQSHATFEPDPGTPPLPSVGFEVLGSEKFNTEKNLKNKITIVTPETSIDFRQPLHLQSTLTNKRS